MCFRVSLKKEDGGGGAWKLESTLDLEVIHPQSSLEGIKFVPLYLH